jgi:hypothetical protein
VCAEIVVNGEVVVFDRGDLIHIDCRQRSPVPRFSAQRKSPRRVGP